MKKTGIVSAAAFLFGGLGEGAAPALANPKGMELVSGKAVLSRKTPSQWEVIQHSETALLNWEEFSLQAGSQLRFVQPSSSALAINRVTGHLPSSISGQLLANGRVYLINPNGIVIGPQGRVDAAGFMASTIDMSGTCPGLAKALEFSPTAHSPALLSHAGQITLSEGGRAILAGPQISVTGDIIAPQGQVDLAIARGFTVDLTGDGLIRFASDDGLSALDGLADTTRDRLELAGRIIADGGQISISARAAAAVMAGSVNMSGLVRARRASQQGGVIRLTSDLPVLMGQDARIDARNNDRVSAPEDTAGQISITAPSLSAGGQIDASGPSGGTITLSAENKLTLAGGLNASGASGKGGSITATARRVLESNSSSWQAGGLAAGGKLSLSASQSAALSGSWQANSQNGAAGRIDVTAPDLRLLSAKMTARGGTAGGLLRLGGAFQGGKAVAGSQDYLSFVSRWGELPNIANASQLLINDGSQLDVSASDGPGGTAIIWSDSQTTFLGAVTATGTIGGQLELSSAGTLRKAALDRIDLGGGKLLLDPKNITIGTSAETQSWAFQGILGQWQYDGLDNAALDASDNFGQAVALDSDGNRLAVGAPGDDGATGSSTNAGAVYLYRFANSTFGSGTLASIIGNGYSGGSNLSVTTLANGDRFGAAVALDDDGNRLAAGAPGDDGSGGTDTGSAYLFTFSDANFAGASLASQIGSGSGLDVHLNALDSGDEFGHAIALNSTGSRFAIGAPGDDGSGVSGTDNYGAIWVFSTGSEDDFAAADIDHTGTIGSSYSGSDDMNLSGLDSGDRLGSALALSSDNSLMAIGVPGDDGSTNQRSNGGAVRLVSFSDSSFSGGTQMLTIGHGYGGDDDISLTLTAETGWAARLLSMAAAPAWQPGHRARMAQMAMPQLPVRPCFSALTAI